MKLSFNLNRRCYEPLSVQEEKNLAIEMVKARTTYQKLKEEQQVLEKGLEWHSKVVQNEAQVRPIKEAAGGKVLEEYEASLANSKRYLEKYSPDKNTQLADAEAEYHRLRNKMANHCMRAVFKMANGVKMSLGSEMSSEDFFNSCYIGLLDAIDDFDPNKGTRLATFAYMRMMRAGQDAHHIDRVIQFPVNQMVKARTIAKDIQKALAKNEVDKVVELENQLTKDHRMVFELMRGSVSTDTPIGDDGEGRTLNDTLPSYTFITDTGDFYSAEEAESERIKHQTQIQARLNAVLEKLTPTEKEVLCSLAGIGVEEPIPLKELAKQLGLKKATVESIKSSAQQKLYQIGGQQSIFDLV